MSPMLTMNSDSAAVIRETYLFLSKKVTILLLEHKQSFMSVHTFQTCSQYKNVKFTRRKALSTLLWAC